MKILAKAPARVDPAGGGTDAPPYCVDYGGSVVNFSISRYSRVEFQWMPDGHGISIYSKDLDQGVHVPSVNDLQYDGQIDFIKAFVKRFIPNNRSCIVVTSSEIPERTGLGGSGALGVALTGALAKATGKTLNKCEIALLANEIERKDLGFSGGSQDSYGAAVGGAKWITYNPNGSSSCESIDLPIYTQQTLERQSLMIYTGEVHLSGSIHSDIKKSYELVDSPTVKAMHNLRKAADAMAQALTIGNIKKYIECLNRSRENHYALHQSCDSDTLRHFFRTLSPYIEGGKTCGAGGGGFIFVHTKKSYREACIAAAKELGALVWPFQFDFNGIQVAEHPGDIEGINGIIEQTKTKRNKKCLARTQLLEPITQ